MSRFSNSNFRSLNESIQNLNSTNRITELEQYVDMLESVIISIAEQMECDTEELVEMAVTAGRGREHEAKINRAETKAYRFMNPDNRKGLFGKDGKAKSPAALKKGKELEKGEKTARSDYDKEVKSKKLFDKGGKVVTKGKAATFVNGMRMTRADMRRAREEGND
jgi:hypothetical protein